MTTVTENRTPRAEEVQLLREVAAYVRFLAFSTAKPVLERELADARDRAVYQASKGKSIRSVVTGTGVSFGSVHRRWQQWAARGLMVRSSGEEGRWERLFDLEELGLLESTGQ